MDYEIRIRFPVDDVVLSRLHGRAFGGNGERVHGWAAQLERHALTWVGAFDGSVLIGFVQVAWDGGVHAFILDTAVDPAYRRRGIGRAVVRVAAEKAAAAGCEWLHVDFEPHLRAFYAACGFRPTDAGLIRL
ncbi:MAG TPA: GNAT family N-acetyltransferase [Mycobacteriales bacterium]|nr:GNAT family N-acetyltransferase [Mycobacteriales bacterium]